MAVHLVDDADAPANYSVVTVGGDQDLASRARPFHLLYYGATLVVRTQDAHRLIEALFGYLGSHLAIPPNGQLMLDAVGLVADGKAAIAPAEIGYVMPMLDRHLDVKGVRVIDRPWLSIDAESSELVVDDRGLDIDRSALATLHKAVSPQGRPDPPVGRGRYTLAGWGFGVRLDQADHNLSRAEALVLAWAHLLNRPQLGPRGALEALAMATRSVHRATIWAEKRDDLIRSLVALLREPCGTDH